MKAMNNKNIKTAIASIALAFMVILGSGQAHALLITDSYVFVGPSGGSAILKMKNTSNRPEAYRLDWAELLMNENGSRTDAGEQELAAAGVMAASPYMYVAPRRLMIQPNQLQNLRFMVRRNNNLVPGEYRSYIVIGPEEIPANFDPESGETVQSVGGGHAVQITMLTGYRIPVFFLHGETTLETSFSNISVEPSDAGRYRLTYTLNRSGTRSALGQVRIFCDAPDGREKIIRRMDTRIFKELSSRTYTREIRLDKNECSNFQIGFFVHSQDPAASQSYMATAPLNIR